MAIATPNVRLVAHTVLADGFPDIEPQDGDTDADFLAEGAGRSCYESWTRPNPKTRKNEDYLKHIIELQHNCYSADTEVLTLGGWKPWPEVTMADTFATLSVDGEIQYQRPSEVIKDRYVGEMVSISNRGVDFMVTPNHRMLACKTTTKRGRKRQDFELVSASEVEHVSHAYRKDGSLEYRPDVLDEDWAWLLGFFIGDGTLHHSARQPTWHLKKRRKIDALKRALMALGLEFKESPSTTCSGAVKIAVDLPGDKLEMFRSCYADDRQKIVPHEIMRTASSEDCVAIMDGLLDSDGSRIGTGICFDSSSKVLRDQFMTLALHSGLAANEVEGSTHETGTYKVVGGSVATVRHTCKRLCLVRRNLRPEIGRPGNFSNADKVERVDYDGYVYCATVPNHTLYVRRNGKPAWSGNSVLEHASATFYLTGVSRALLAEISRHRHLSLSVVSQRFVDESEANIVVPPAIRELGMGSYLDDVMVGASRDYSRLVRDLTDVGLPRKQAREAARAVLPNMTETKIVVTGSMAAWRYVIARRIDPSADAEMREVAGMILAELKKLAPASFQDFE